MRLAQKKDDDGSCAIYLYIFSCGDAERWQNGVFSETWAERRRSLTSESGTPGVKSPWPRNARLFWAHETMASSMLISRGFFLYRLSLNLLSCTVSLPGKGYILILDFWFYQNPVGNSLESWLHSSLHSLTLHPAVPLFKQRTQNNECPRISFYLLFI